MEISDLIVGFVLICFGFLVKIYPNLIAGYNIMPKNRKKEVDIKGLSSMVRNMFVILGIVIIVKKPVLRLLGYEAIAMRCCL